MQLTKTMDVQLNIGCVKASVKLKQCIAAIKKELAVTLSVRYFNSLANIKISSYDIVFLAEELLNGQPAPEGVVYLFGTDVGSDIAIDLAWPEQAIQSLLRTIVSGAEERKKQIPETEIIRLQKVAEKYNALSSTSPDLVFFIDEDGFYLDALTSTEELLAAEKSSLGGHTIYEILPPNLSENVRVCMQTALETGETVDLEYCLDLPIGTRWFHARIADMGVLTDGKKTLVCQSRDITENKKLIADMSQLNTMISNQLAVKTEEWTRCSQLSNENILRFAEVAAMLPEGIVEITENGIITYCNAQIEKLTGYTHSEIIGKNITFFVEKKMRNDIKRLISNHANSTIQYANLILRNKDEKDVEFELILNPFYRNEKLAGYRCLLVDISRTVRREQLLKEQALFVRFNPAPCFKANTEGIIESSNPATVRIFKQNIKGLHISEIFPLEDLTLEQTVFSTIKQFDERTMKFTAVRGLYNDHIYFYGADITDIIDAQKINKRLVATLQEKLKKLECLMAISKGIQSAKSVQPVIDLILSVLPASYQFPDITCVQIKYFDQVYKTDNFQNTSWKQTVNIHYGVDVAGIIDVRYTEFPGKFFEGPFLQEERHLISAIAFLFSSFAKRLRVEQENKILRKAVEQNPASILICDASGTIEFVNSEYQRSSGYSENELIGNTPSILNSGEHKPDFFSDMWQTIKSGKIWTGDILNKSKQGSLYWEHGSISPIYDENGTLTHFVEVKENITERKKIEKQLFQAKIHAEKANKAKSEFLANISHEIRTPLNSIIGYADLLGGDLAKTAHMERLNSIKVSSRNLLTLINDILDLAKIESGKLEFQYKYINIKRLLTEIESVFSLRVQEKGLLFTCIVPDRLPKAIYIDSHRLRQVLVNLLSNAIKFTEKGKVVIEVLFSVHQEDKLALSISVADTGPGISESQLEEIFQNFSQGTTTQEKQVEGTGLGLSISRRLVELMHGKLTVESHEGTGSVFTVMFDSLSFENRDQTQYVFDEQYEKSVRFKGQKIFVIDDQKVERNFIAIGLEKAGLAVKVFESGELALECIDSFPPDLILTDVVMPNMDGYEFARKLRESGVDAPIVAMSASVMSEADRMKAYPYFNSLMIKPFTLSELKLSMQSFLEFDKLTLESVSTEDPVHGFGYFDQTVYSHFYDEWVKFEVTQPFDEVREFALALQVYGQEQQMDGLCNYAKSILAALDAYNVESLLSNLKLFPALCGKVQAET